MAGTFLFIFDKNIYLSRTLKRTDGFRVYISSLKEFEDVFISVHAFL